MTALFVTTDIESRLLEIGPDQNGVSLTPDEFDAADFEEGYSYELIRRVLVVNPIPSEAERDPIDELGYLLRRYRDVHPQDSCLDATLSEQYVRTATCRRRADRVIWAGLGRLPAVKTDLPTIAVEFVSAGRRNWHRDYVEKRDEYLALGIREYWVIDRFRRTLTVCRLTDGKLEQQVVAEGGVYQPSLLPGFALPLQALLQAANRWENG